MYHRLVALTVPLLLQLQSTPSFAHLFEEILPFRTRVLKNDLALDICKVKEAYRPVIPSGFVQRLPHTMSSVPARRTCRDSTEMLPW